MPKRAVIPTSRRETLWYADCPLPSAFGLAVRLGWVEEELSRDGIKWVSLAQANDRGAHESYFFDGSLDSFHPGGNIPAICARAEGADTHLIGLSWTGNPHVILTLPGSGIKTIGDLRGRRLGLARQISDQLDIFRLEALRMYEVALATEGLRFRDVNLVDIPVAQGHFDATLVGEKPGESLSSALSIRRHQREEFFALIRGDVDAIFAESALGNEAALCLGAHIVYDVRWRPGKLAHSDNVSPHTLTVSGRLLEERPDLVARVLAQVLRAANWAKSHHEEVVRFVAAESGSAEETVDLAYGPALSQQLDVNLSPEKVEAILKQKEFLMRQGIIRTHFAFEDWIDPRPLEDAFSILAQREQLDAWARLQRDPRRPTPALPDASSPASLLAQSLNLASRFSETPSLGTPRGHRRLD